MDLEDIKYSDELLLVVDDDESVRTALLEMLRHIGFKAKSAGNGKDALKELKEDSYTFTLTDIRMPEMDGLQLIKAIKNDYPHIYCIAMTGYSKEYKYVDVINAGATDFINKPFSLEELEAKVRRGIIERNIKEELSRLSITDSLTGLYNQRHFYARLKEEVTRADRQKNRLALILVDLDDFKNYNDTHGHLAGDDILHKVGSIINVKIRLGVDSGYRYGGDEFAVILIDADEDISLSIGERIGQGINQECNLSASMGFSNFSEGMTLEGFIGEADRRLYKSKAQRKNNEGSG
ncbi:MAG: diguanylate cyclase [Desulfobacteraceae bacterium]|nr:diguanylate cyclase [Desulfobacteraceae bacterium]